MKLGFSSFTAANLMTIFLSSGMDFIHPINHYFQNSQAISHEENINESTNHLRRRNIAETEISIPLFGATYVNENKPTNNYHASTSIEVDNDPIKKVSFLEFDINCVNGPVTRIELALPVKDPSNHGGRISTTTSSLDLENLNWINAPGGITGSVSIGRVRVNEMKMINLPISFLGNYPNKMFALRIDAESGDGADYYKNGITLKLTYEGTPNYECEVPNPPNPDHQTEINIPLSRATFVKENSPNNNYQGSRYIEVDNDPAKKISFLEFNIRCINGPVRKIELVLFVKDPSNHGGRISTTDTNLEIGDIDWRNAPESIMGSISIGRVRAEEVKIINLPIYFLGNNPNTAFFLRIDAESGDGADYYKSGIYLKITYEGTPIPGCELPNPTNPRNELTTISFAPSGSTFIHQNSPDQEFSNENTVEVDLDKSAFIKFNVECINGPIENIDLALLAQNESNHGGKISKTDSNWYSHDVTWNNAPVTTGNEYIAIDKVDAGTKKVVSIPNHFLDDYQGRELSLRIDPQSDNGAIYHKNGILLEVTYRGKLAQGCELLPSPPIIPPPSDYFQMKLYWEEGYYWQENKSEKRFCADCNGECSSGKVKLRECDYRKDRQFWRWNNGKLESKEGPGYCMSYEGTANEGEKISMKTCNSATKFMGILTPPNENRFMWHAQGNNYLCVTNPHHPRGNEELRFNKCNVALIDETAFWVTGTTWTSLGGYPSS